MKKSILILLLLASSANAAQLLFDDFEYEVSQIAPGANSFVTVGPWDGVKANNDSEPNVNAAMILSTETSIPGFSGQFPSGSRVMRINVRSETQWRQTDAYLFTYNWPGDVWVQHWIYINDYGTEQSELADRNKWLYPYDASADHRYIMYAGPLYCSVAATGDPVMGFGSRTENGFYTYTSDQVPWDTNLDAGVQTLDQNEDDTTCVQQNGWYLVKMHYNTSATSGNSLEVWIAPQGGEFTKVSEWIGGTTTDFTWNLHADFVGDHDGFKFLTTFPGNNICSGVGDSDCRDAWIYIDDFVIAESESDLPIYGASTPTTSLGITASGVEIR